MYNMLSYIHVHLLVLMSNCSKLGHRSSFKKMDQVLVNTADIASSKLSEHLRVLCMQSDIKYRHDILFCCDFSVNCFQKTFIRFSAYKRVVL